MTPAIEDYAVIGDCRSAALVSRRGSIDWLCWPRFDSPSLFGALLEPSAGRWQLSPTGPYESRRAYLDETNVLQTVFQTPTGRLVVTDLMTVAREREKHATLMPDHEILRIADCVAGEVEVEQAYAPRPRWGVTVRLRDCGALGIRANFSRLGRGVVYLRTDQRLAIDGGDATGRMRLRAGESIHASLAFADDEPATLPPLGLWSRRALTRSIDWWRRWSRHLRYDGPYRDAVLRSALALKLLIFAPSGAIVAAPTTSLPERIGGPLNWDYRYCWLRDASLTIRALLGLGYRDEADAFIEWLLHTTRLTWPRLKILYDVFGNRPTRERTLHGWRGYHDSRPVRLGNAAVEQLQLDVYGEVIDATAQLARAGMRFDRETQRMLVGFGRHVARVWRDPDEGIWEPRSGRAPHTHSRLLCWVALDRLIELGDCGWLAKVPRDQFVAAREAIRRELETRAWNPRLRSYVSTIDGDDIDATLLLLSWYGFERADSPRMRATFRRVVDTLGADDALLYRYANLESPGEGAFGVCSFWGVEHLALEGALDAAQARFASLCRRANDLGLYAEEIDPSTGAALGNFPQAFSHIGLINAAITLERRRRELAEAADEEATA